MHAWERIGAAITHIARKFLKIAVLRYVDDLFAPERCASSFHTGCCSPIAYVRMFKASDHEARIAMFGQANQSFVRVFSGRRQEACVWEKT